MTNIQTTKNTTIIGAGFTGLTAAYELAKKGLKVTVLESDTAVGGLASAFEIEGNKIDRFYHHWFTSDREVMALINELDLDHLVKVNPTSTGIYYANNFFKLSTPWDLINFTPLSFIDRIRLGVLAILTRKVKNWELLENKTARDWLIDIGGANVYRVVWEPLLKGKFGPYAEKISAVWFWNKIKLRGGSRSRGGKEHLAYLEGGFITIAEVLAKRIKELGGEILTNHTVKEIKPIKDKWEVVTQYNNFLCDNIIATTALPLIAEFIKDWADPVYIHKLQRIHYLSNVCLVLELEKSLSNTYWLNVNDPTFPFVGVIEHTNFESAENYGGRHIVYLSKYLPHTDKLYSMSSEEFLDYAMPFIMQMFPLFEKKSIKKHYLWRARWSQPVVEKQYGQLIPSDQSPYNGLYICSMAQIYPEDRGTNYAIRAAINLTKKYY